MTRRSKALALVAVVIAVATAVGCGDGGGEDSTAPTTVRVAAAADLKFALEEVKAELARIRPQIDLAPTYGSSGTFFQQLSNGAPFDLYLSADLSYPEQLVQAGLSDQDDLFEYAVGRIVVWAANGSPVDPTRGLAPAVTDPGAAKIAIANPEHAPYGKAAVSAMRSAGVYEEVENKFVLGENIAQAAEFAQSGNAQVGVIALALALSPQLQDKGRYSEIPLESYPRIDQGGVVMNAAADPEAAHAVKDFLLSDGGTEILKRYGFFLPAT